MNRVSTSIATLRDAIKGGDRPALARAITLVENEGPGSNELLLSLKGKEIPVVGITGPPGAGKSTLINALLRLLVSENKKVAVVAVDPTSPFNYGSLLGDRLRMSEHFNDPRIFIRSLATRGSLGGLSGKIIEVTDVLRAADFDFILIETVGVGQSEVEIAGLADTTIVVMVPESGDDIQAMKSGIMEIGDIFVVNKADREGAGMLVNNLKKMLTQKSRGEWTVPVLPVMATTGEGIQEIYSQIIAHKRSAAFGEKRTYLLAEKAWRLISRRRMAGVSREALNDRIRKEAGSEGFNLYRLAEEMAK